MGNLGSSSDQNLSKVGCYMCTVCSHGSNHTIGKMLKNTQITSLMVLPKEEPKMLFVAKQGSNPHVRGRLGIDLCMLFSLAQKG